MPDTSDHWLRVLRTLPEAQRRWLAGAKALESGRGGLTRVQRATGFSINTVAKGMREVRAGLPSDTPDRLRRPGAGRPPVEKVAPATLNALKHLVEPSAAGSPMGALRWTHKSTRTLAEELTRQRHPVSPNTVGRLLEVLGYSLQVNAKSKEGRSPPERDAQFRYINEQVVKFQAAGNPVLSVDAKKKERVGEFKNGGAQLPSRGQAGRGQRLRFSRPRSGSRGPIRSLRRQAKPRVRERGDEP